MPKQERPNAELSTTSKVVDLGKYRAVREEVARKRRALEYLTEMRIEADRIAEPILNSTERYLDER